VLVLRASILLMVVLAIIKLGDEFQRLTVWPAPLGANDLRLLATAVQSWFAGVDTYELIVTAVYPPATYALLWPILGLFDIEVARWIWAGLTVAVLVWLAALFVRESGAESRLQKTFVALLLISMNATGVTVGMGQMALHQLALIIAAVLLLRRSRGGWGVDLFAAALMLLALVKPTVSAPFFWLIIFLPGRLRPAIMVVAGYLLLTWVGLAAQDGAALATLSSAARMGLLGLEDGARDAYANLHTWLGSLGLMRLNLPGSLLVLVGLGTWVFRNRQADVWVLLGVTGIIARLWTYHRVYDDVLLLPAMLCLYRIARTHDSSDRGLAAGALLGVAVLSMLAPARIREWPHPWDWMFKGEHLVLWLVMLGFLLMRPQEPPRSTAEMYAT